MTETTSQLLAELEVAEPERRAEIEAKIHRRGHSPAFLRVARVFADHSRYADDALIGEILAAARGPRPVFIDVDIDDGELVL